MMVGFNQRTCHHKYTLDVHCQRLKEEIEKRTDDKVLIRAALIHDIGKLFTGKPKDDDSGDYCYYSHFYAVPYNGADCENVLFYYAHAHNVHASFS